MGSRQLLVEECTRLGPVAGNRPVEGSHSPGGFGHSAASLGLDTLDRSRHLAVRIAGRVGERDKVVVVDLQRIQLVEDYWENMVDGHTGLGRRTLARLLVDLGYH